MASSIDAAGDYRGESSALSNRAVASVGQATMSSVVVALDSRAASSAWAWAAIAAALAATCRSSDEGLEGASAARMIRSAFSMVAWGSSGTGAVSIWTSPETA